MLRTWGVFPKIFSASPHIRGIVPITRGSVIIIRGNSAKTGGVVIKTRGKANNIGEDVIIILLTFPICFRTMPQ